MDWLNECTSGENLPNGLYRTQIGIAPRAVRLDGYLREIASTWQQGDGDLPHLVSQAPIGVGIADSGRRRLYPVAGDLSRYMEIGAPLIKPAATWQSVGFSGATRQGNRITWSRSQANLSIVHGGHYCKLDIELRGGYVPPSRQFAFPVSLVGLTRSGARILADGQTVMLLRPPVVYDAANPLDIRPIDWQFGAIGGQTGVLFTLPSLAGMARPIVDPTLALQPGAADGMDTFIRTEDATPQGTNADFAAIMSGTGWAWRALMQFSGLPASGTVTSATLSTTCSANLGAAAVAVHQLTASWDEATATWATRDGVTAWTAAGGDYDATAIATINPASYVSGTVYTFDVTSLVQLWIDGTTNNGMLLKVVTETGAATGLQAASSDNATAANRPLLTITYTEAAASSPSGGTGRGRSTLCREARNRWL